VPQGTTVCFPRERIGADFDGLCDLAYAQRNVDADSALHFNSDRLANQAPESGMFDFEFVLAGYQVNELILPAESVATVRRSEVTNLG
jgi:hypothetical protein